MLGKLVADTMPGGIALSGLRKLLQERWGLGPGHSDSALVFSLCMQPQTRLSSETEVHDWIASVVASYAHEIGLDLSQSSSHSSGTIYR